MDLRGDPLLVAARQLARREMGLAVAVTIRADGHPHAAVVNAGVIEPPTPGDAAVGFVVQGRRRAKIAHLRARPIATVVFRAGREWIAIEGDVELFGPEDQQLMPWPDLALIFHSIYVESIGGSL